MQIENSPVHGKLTTKNFTSKKWRIVQDKVSDTDTQKQPKITDFRGIWLNMKEFAIRFLSYKSDFYHTNVIR